MRSHAFRVGPIKCGVCGCRLHALDMCVCVRVREPIQVVPEYSLKLSDSPNRPLRLLLEVLLPGETLHSNLRCGCGKAARRSNRLCMH